MRSGTRSRGGSRDLVKDSSAGIPRLNPHWYDYRTRFGSVGQLIDRLVFRRLIGWATAWSFDRLRLWIEREVPPEISLRMASIHALARLGIAFTWMWQGLVPKLMFDSPDEKAMLRAAGLPLTILPVTGALELLFAALILLFWRRRSLFLVNILLMVGALIPIVAGPQSRPYLVAAFNPVTLNVGMILLSAIGYLSSAELPSAARCHRHATN